MLSGEHLPTRSASKAHRLPFVTTPSSILLRQLFPSWEFFDVARLPPTLQLRVLCPNEAAGDWLEVVRAAPRRWWHLILNPAGTQTLAAQTLVERWYTELLESGEDALICRDTFVLVQALAESALIGGAQATTTTTTTLRSDWQLRLVVVDEESGDVEVVYESARFPAANALTINPLNS